MFHGSKDVSRTFRPHGMRKAMPMHKDSKVFSRTASRTRVENHRKGLARGGERM